ncbi:hypothetical protein [Pseudonocardia sp. T1-2H]|uniref:hypothetical protein n=1 Tax=Pseudonocardia sp. T1-2H TaxID=3128899 RepID=UPI003100CF2D
MRRTTRNPRRAGGAAGGTARRGDQGQARRPTPEPRYSWALGRCDLPAYAESCDRVRVVRDLTGLEATAHEMADELIGR